ncbi:MAG: DUF1493 family protein [Niabella sp.]
MKKDHWALVVEFIKIHWPIKNEILTRATRMQEDLGIKGDDADNIIYEFSKAFNINIDNLDLSNYFTGYNEDIISIIKGLINRKSLKKYSLTLGDLEEALSLGELSDRRIIFRTKNQ